MGQENDVKRNRHDAPSSRVAIQPGQPPSGRHAPCDNHPGAPLLHNSEWRSIRRRALHRSASGEQAAWQEGDRNSKFTCEMKKLRTDRPRDLPSPYMVWLCGTRGRVRDAGMQRNGFPMEESGRRVTRDRQMPSPNRPASSELRASKWTLYI